MEKEIIDGHYLDLGRDVSRIWDAININIRIRVDEVRNSLLALQERSSGSSFFIVDKIQNGAPIKKVNEDRQIESTDCVIVYIKDRRWTVVTKEWFDGMEPDEMDLPIFTRSGSIEFSTQEPPTQSEKGVILSDSCQEEIGDQ